MEDSELLDVVKEGFALKNDAELSKFLEVCKTTISKIRSGDRHLGLMQKLKVLDKISFLTACNWVEKLSPEFLGRLIRRTNRALTQRRVQGLDGARYKNDAELLILFKEHGEFQTDDQLARYLDLKPTSLPSIKCGRSSLGLKPRLQIFNFFFPQDAQQVRNSLLDTRNLADAVLDWSARHR